MRRGTFRTGPRLPASVGEFRTVSKPSSDLLKARKVSSSTLASFSEFLKLPQTGIFRLLKAPECDAKSDSRTDPCDQKRFETLLHGSSYSIINGEHEWPGFAQIALKDGKLTSVGTAIQGILTDLGNVRLEDLSPSSDGVKYLAAFQPALQIADVEAQWLEFNKVVDADGYRFMQSLWVRTSSTYAMRSVKYKLSPPAVNTSWDMIVVLRVVSVEPDGITVAYRVLSRKKGPELEY